MVRWCVLEWRLAGECVCVCVSAKRKEKRENERKKEGREPAKREEMWVKLSG